MPAPSVIIDLDVIAANTRRVTGWLDPQGISTFGVTKAACGSPLVARAMLRGGVAGLADSRLDNVQRMRHSGITAPIMMLRIPSVTEAPEVVRLCDISLNSEAAVLDALAAAEDLLPLAKSAMAEPSLRLAGIGANFMCASGVLPTVEKLQRLVHLAEDVEQRFGTRLDYVSGGNSGNLALMEAEGVAMPARINNLRVGAAILRGENSITGGTLQGFDSSAFTL